MIDENLACLLDDSEEENKEQAENNISNYNTEYTRKEERNERSERNEKNEKNERDERNERDEGERRNKLYYHQEKLIKNSKESSISEHEDYKIELNKINDSGTDDFKSDDSFDFSKRKKKKEADNHKQYKNEKWKDEKETQNPQNFYLKGNKRKWENEIYNSEYNNNNNNMYNYNINNYSTKKNKYEEENISYIKNNSYAKLRNLKNTTIYDSPSLRKTSFFKEKEFPEKEIPEKEFPEKDSDFPDFDFDFNFDFDFSENAKNSTRHDYVSKNDYSLEKSSRKSKIDLFHENLVLQLSSDKGTFNEVKINNNNRIHIEESEKQEFDKNYTIKKNEYLENNNKNLSDQLLKKNNKIFSNKLEGNKNNTLKQTVFEKQKKQKGFITEMNNTNISNIKYKENIDSIYNSEYNQKCKKKNDFREESNKSNISTSLVGPAGLRQKLKSFNNIEAEKNKDLIFHYSFIKYKSWIKALNILDFPLNNFNLSINSYKYLLSDVDAIYNKTGRNGPDAIINNIYEERKNENLFMYQNNIHNILKNTKISNYRIDRMLVLIKSILSRHNGYFLIVMDPSGHMPATLHKEIEKEHKRNIDIGSTLFLRNVTVFQTIDNFPYLVITLRSLVRVIKAEQTEDELKEKIFNQLQL